MTLNFFVRCLPEMSALALHFHLAAHLLNTIRAANGL